MPTVQHAARVPIGSASVPAVASRGIQNLLEGPSRPGVLLGITARTAWLQTGGHVLVVAGPEAVRLPNGVQIAEPDREVWSQAVDRCRVGEGHLEVGNVRAKVVRWWDPRPILEPVTQDELAERAAQARGCFPSPEDAGLGTALMAKEPAAVRHAMCALLGKGEGLTPAGDDVVVGMLAALRLLGPAIGDPGAGGLMAAVAPIVLTEAPFRTTALSAALLRHAVVGEIAEPAGALISALTGHGDLEDAADRLNAMGNTSGAATAGGILLAVAALVEGRAP